MEIRKAIIASGEPGDVQKVQLIVNTILAEFYASKGIVAEPTSPANPLARPAAPRQDISTDEVADNILKKFQIVPSRDLRATPNNMETQSSTLKEMFNLWKLAYCGHLAPSSIKRLNGLFKAILSKFGEQSIDTLNESTEIRGYLLAMSAVSKQRAHYMLGYLIRVFDFYFVFYKKKPCVKSAYPAKILH